MTLILSPLLVWFVSYGMINRPLVEYTFGGADKIRLAYQDMIAFSKNSPGTIDILNVYVRNRGATDIRVIVTVRAVNALVSASYGGPYNEIASAALTIPAETILYRFITFYITLRSQVASFTLSSQVGRFLDFSTFSSSIASIFSGIEPISPNLLRYSQETGNPYDYQLVQQS
jgi:hypothetical protein